MGYFQNNQSKSRLVRLRPLSNSKTNFRQKKIAKAIEEVFDLRPKAIIEALDLLRPIYAQTASYGHFGRELPNFTWERTNLAATLRAAAGLK